MREFLPAVLVLWLIVAVSPLAFGAPLAEEGGRSGQRQDQGGQIVEAGAKELDKGNFAQAIALFQKAASQGEAEGHAALSVMYAFGLGVKKDCTVAMTLSREAIASGSLGAQYNMGVMYANGVCVEKNEVTAIEWYSKAASNKYSPAMFALGNRYVNGVGVPKDEAEGLRLIRSAAEQGFAPAQVNIGVRHVHGIGVPKDMAQAGRLFRMAAKQGDASGQAAVGALYAELGTPEDNVHAYMWASLAAAQGYAKAKELLGLLDSRLIPAQKAEAQKRARDWRPVATQRVMAEAYLIDAVAAKADVHSQPQGDVQQSSLESVPRGGGFVSSLDPNGPSAQLARVEAAQKAAQVVAEDAARVKKAPWEGMGFGEAVSEGLKRGLFPTLGRAVADLTKQTPLPQPNWENPAKNDDRVPQQYKLDLYSASTAEEYEERVALLRNGLEWESKLEAANSLGKFGYALARVLDPLVVLVVGVYGLIRFARRKFRELMAS